MSPLEIWNALYANWFWVMAIIAISYASHNRAEHKYYEKGYKHGYHRAKAIYGKGNLK